MLFQEPNEKHKIVTYLPQKELQPDDRYCFEQYPPNCYNKDKKTTIVDTYVPIKRLI